MPLTNFYLSLSLLDKANFVRFLVVFYGLHFSNCFKLACLGSSILNKMSSFMNILFVPLQGGKIVKLNLGVTE